MTTVPLNELVTFQRGFDLPETSRRPGDVPVIASRNIVGFHDEAKVTAPGVVIGRSGSIGGGQYINEDFWPLNTTLWIKDYKGNYPRYIYYLCRSIDFSALNVGVGVPTLNRNHLSTIKVQTRQLHEQIAIADVLSNYDNLIENVQRRITLLEEAVRLLYREWFVHFRFPGHEYVKIIDGYPESWNRLRLSEVVSTQYGHTASAEEDEVGPHLLRGTDINKRSYIDWSSVPFCSEQNLDFEKYALSPGDLLVIRMADPGKVALVEKRIRAVFASYLVRLKIKDPDILPPLFLFMVLGDDRYQGFINASSGGSTRKSANAKLLTNFYFDLPPDKVIQMFVERVSPVRAMINNLADQSSALAEARDLLLPRLMKGSILV